MKLINWLIITMLIIGAIYGGYVYRDKISLLHAPAQPSHATAQEEESFPAESNSIIVSEQAQLNLGLKAKPLESQIYWKTIQVPGMIVDRPGQSDRTVVSPVIGSVTMVYHFPGDIVHPGNPLFKIKILSESLQLIQTELFKATQEIAIYDSQKNRLLSASSAVPEARIIEIDNQISRLGITTKAYRQELQNRGVTTELINKVAEGQFINEMTISVPYPTDLIDSEFSEGLTPEQKVTFEIQDLKIDLGQQVQVGQTLCLIANHQKLSIEGRAFPDETQLLERSVKENWPVEVDFKEEASDWEKMSQNFFIRHLSNTVDPQNRTFAFRMPLTNQSRVIEESGRKQTLWRYRPGQKVRLLIRVEKLENVFVLPGDAVATEGAESYIFTQNVNTFERLSVRLLLHDRQQVVFANDKMFEEGIYVVQSSAEQLNRMFKSGENTGVPKGYHIHADGSLHKNEDEGK
jgi:biotin carboxyl carrier protein